MIKEKCAVFGVYGKNIEAGRLTYFGLYALQHRGQEGSGIASTNGKEIIHHRAPGLVAQVYNEESISKLVGHAAIGHNRYSTSGGNSYTHLQPIVIGDIAVAHNGNLPSVTDLKNFLEPKGVGCSDCTDSELMAEAIAWYIAQGNSVEDSVTKAFPLFTGAFALLIMTPDKLIGVRDAQGIRPLCLGKLDGGYILSSETCALDTVHAEFVREIQAGEMVVIDKNGICCELITKGKENLDIFEFIYFSRPDSMLLGKSVDAVRRNFGIELARETLINADIVVPVPDSAIPAAFGYAQESGIPFYSALIKNRYIGRTFIEPEQHLRDFAVSMKLNPVRGVLKDKRVIIIDDSIVRGTTSPKVVAMLREAGATEVHFLVSSPPYKFPDFYGMDTPDQEKLIAAHHNLEEIREFLGADSLHYLSYEGMIRATGLKEDNFCTACFTGKYPIDIRENKKRVSWEVA